MSMEFNGEKPKEKVVQINIEKERLDMKAELSPEQRELLKDCDLTIRQAKGGVLQFLGAFGAGGLLKEVIKGKTPEGKIEITFDPNASGSSDTIWSATGKIEGKKVSDEKALKLAYKYRAIAEFQTREKGSAK